MSSKFSNLLSQARNRPNDEHDVDEAKPEVGTSQVQEQEAQPTIEEKKTPSKPKGIGKQKAPVPVELALPQPNRGRPRTGKRSDPNYTQITAYISKQTHKDVKLALLKEGNGRELSEIIEERLLLWLKSHS